MTEERRSALLALAVGLWRRRSVRAAASVALLTLAAGGGLAVLAGDPGDSIRRAALDSRTAGALFLFGWSFAIFLTVLPLGTATILIAGAALGAWAGSVQFAALVVASAVLFEVSGEQRQEDAVRFVKGRPRVFRIIEAFRTRGILATAVLRLAPVVPSAVCSLAAAGLGIGRWKFYIGTLMVGWVRPVIFAYMGATAAKLAPI